MENLKETYKILSEYMPEFGNLENMIFNIIKIEGLRDRHSFSDLIRGILVVKEVKNAG